MKRYRSHEIPEKTGPGVYWYFLKSGAVLPNVPVDQTGLLYVGKTKTQSKRNHFRTATPVSTLRRSLGAILKDGLKLEAHCRGLGKKSSIEDKDATHYRFSPQGEGALSKWMEDNLEFSFEILEGGIAERETAEIRQLRPPLNLDQWQNPNRELIMNLRKICSDEAKRNSRNRAPESVSSSSRLILASASPRRRELLAQAGFAFEVRAADIPEEPRAGEDPIAYVVRLAREKAEAVYRDVGTEGLGTTELAVTGPLIVLGADTTVTLDGHILGKPEDAADAARMLRMLSGRTHRVITGVALVGAGRTEMAAEMTAVKFLTLSDEEIAAYVATGEPMDKAGAYAIQGLAAKWIPRIEGDYFNVVGLPLALVSSLLEGFTRTIEGCGLPPISR